MTASDQDDCRTLHQEILQQRDLIIASNRGPFSFQMGDDGEMKLQRSGGGLVTALLGLAEQVPSTWVSSAASDSDRAWKEGDIPLGDNNHTIHARFVNPSPEAYDLFYGVISNPLLWFLQHSIWGFAQAPTLNRSTWNAWEEGYVEVNRMFADAIVEQIRRNDRPSLVMLQDYHLYLTPRMIRNRLHDRRGPHRGTILTHFIHIPWPGPEDWGLLPARMRTAILEGLCAVDLIGLQTREDALNFIRTCESLLPDARVNYRKGRVVVRNHMTHVRDFPISINVPAVREQATTEEVAKYREQLTEGLGDRQVILRIDRSEPSKNIVRGFQAYDEMLETYPEHQAKVQFIALLVPSRLEVEEYQTYLRELMAAAGQVNAKYGTPEWEPVRVLVGESYPRALAALQIYDVLLVNPVADGMNLVAKEGPTINEKNGAIILSERAGAHQQLGENALVISPIDVSATAEALHRALIMPEGERHKRAVALRQAVEREDIDLWLCWQLDALQELIADHQAKARRKVNHHGADYPAIDQHAMVY